MNPSAQRGWLSLDDVQQMRDSIDAWTHTEQAVTYIRPADKRGLMCISIMGDDSTQRLARCTWNSWHTYWRDNSAHRCVFSSGRIG